MSHFTVIETQFKDKDALVNALVEIGWDRSVIELPETAQHLYGYQGDRRKQTAEIIIRRRYVGPASNDLGFSWDQASNSYQAIISEYDRTKYNDTWVSKLKQSYSTHLLERELTRRGHRYTKERTPAGVVRLTVHQRG